MSRARGGLHRATTALVVAALTAGCASGVQGAAGRRATPPSTTVAAAAPSGEEPSSAPTTPSTVAPDLSSTSTSASTPAVAATSTVPDAVSGASSTPSTASSTTSSSTPSTASTAPPPSIADGFAAALAGLRVVNHATVVPDGVRDRVARLSLLLGRPPDPDTVVLRTELLVSDVSTIDELASEVIRSPEYAAVQPDPSDRAFVAALYRDVLGRPGSAAERARWIRRLEEGADRAELAVAFTDSAEAIARTGTEPVAEAAVAVDGVGRSTSDGVLRLYLGLLQRFPTSEELEAAVERSAELSLVGVASDLMSSAEYARRRPNLTPTATVDGLYEDLLGREPEPLGRANWTDQLAAGRSAAQIAVDMSRSPEAAQRTLTASPAAVAGDPASTGGAPAGVLAIGDSIMLSAAEALRAAVPGISVNARENRQFTEGIAIVEALAAAGDVPDTVIVHLGTNGLVTPERCGELMTDLPGRRVLLVDIRVPRPWEEDTNEALATCARRFGAEMVDWRAAAHDDVLAGDGYHLNEDGFGVFAATLAAALRASPSPVGSRHLGLR